MWQPHRMGALFQNVLYPSLTWARYTDEPLCYLTFDDGPNPDVTPLVLQELRQRDAKATFFVVGDNVRKHPDVFAQTAEEGHSLGNHTFNHFKGWKTEDARYYDNVALCQAQMARIAPEAAGRMLFRPPYGRIRRRQARHLQGLGYEVVMWDVLSWDFLQSLRPETCLRGTRRALRRGSILVFHDSYKARERMAYALPRLMDDLMEQGFRFERL